MGDRSAATTVFLIAGTAPERTMVARLLAERESGGVYVVGDPGHADAAAGAGRTVALEVDLAAAELGACRTSIAHRPCHVVVVARDADAYAAGAPRVGLWIDPSASTPDEAVDEILTHARSDSGLIVIADYDPAWPGLFQRLAAPVRRAVADLGAEVEHVGSTAVPGLAAKPIVDIDVVVPAAAVVPAAIERLRLLGYVYQGDKGIPGREAFLSPAAAPVHHLYVVAAGNAAHRAHVRFRDLLSARPGLARDYAALKRTLAARHAWDRPGYVDAKAEFIAAVLASSADDRPEQLTPGRAETACGHGCGLHRTDRAAQDGSIMAAAARAARSEIRPSPNGGVSRPRRAPRRRRRASAAPRAPGRRCT